MAVVGDGINDLAAIKASHIGISVGSGSDVAKLAADAILTDDNIEMIAAAVVDGQIQYYNLRKMMAYVLTTNAALIVSVLAAVIFKLPLMITTVMSFTLEICIKIVPSVSFTISDKSRTYE